MGIRVSKVRKTFGDFLAIDDLSLDVDTGSLVALLGQGSLEVMQSSVPELVLASPAPPVNP